MGLLFDLLKMIAGDIFSSYKKIKSLTNSASELRLIQKKIIQKYNIQDIIVNLNSDYRENEYVIRVEFINTMFNNLGKEDRFAAAYETLNIIKDNFKIIDDITKINIKFISNEEKSYLFKKDNYNNWQLIETLDE
jgi:hypothetical protein